MWVYKGDSLRNRLLLDPRLGYWLDYWLFLHSEETHPVWCVRPLSVRLIAQAALQSTGLKEATLRDQLAREAMASARLLSFLPKIPQMPSSGPTAHGKWTREWLHWFETVLRLANPSSIVADMVTVIAQALAQDEYATANFLTRGLAGELAQRDWARNDAFMNVKRVFCDNGDFSLREFNATDFINSLNAVFCERPKSAFNVAFQLAPVGLTKAVARKCENGPRLLIESREDSDGVLVGVEIEVDASNVHEAAALGIEATRRLLEELRLLFYIRTHLCGSVRVSQVEQGLEVHVSLPQPFWKKQHGRREVPRVPPDYSELLSTLHDEQRSRWQAAQWRWSQALSDWAEDTHTAASHVWQALEALSGPGGLNTVLNLIPEFLAYAVRDMAVHLATRVALQSAEIRSLSHRCDWHPWDDTRFTLEEWLPLVLNAESFKFYGHWSLPVPPALLFHRKTGLIQIISRRLQVESSETWMDQRTECDLRLLYGLRNKVVHSGERVFGRRTASYLGQTGAEVLLGIMAIRGESIRGHILDSR